MVLFSSRLILSFSRTISTFLTFNYSHFYSIALSIVTMMATLNILTISSLILITSTTASVTVPPRGFRSFGQTLLGSTNHNIQKGNSHLDFGTTVRLSDNGEYMMAGSSSTTEKNKIVLYQRDDSTIEEALEEVTWNPVWELLGEDGESIGQHWDMNGQGDTMVVRRGNGAAEVYKMKHSPNNYRNEAYRLGAPVNVCGSQQQGGTTVALGQAAAAATAQYNGDWIAITCDSFDQYRGKVVVVHFDRDLQTWKTINTLEGANKGDRFGWATKISVAGGSIVSMTISSPNYDFKRGMVQRFSFNPDLGLDLHQIGTDLTGTSQGDQFGFSLDINVYGTPWIVVGAPGCHGDLRPHVTVNGVPRLRGCVSLYGWQRHKGAGLVAEWHLVGDSPVFGDNDGDKLGRSVAISKVHGERFAASSILANRQSGYVKLFDRDGFKGTKQIAKFAEQDPMNQFGYSVSLNQVGSLLAVGAPRAKNDQRASVGEVSVFLDGNPFCGLALPAYFKTNEIFLERQTCRTVNDGPITYASLCRLHEDDNDWGTTSQCVYRDGLATKSPSTMPSSTPTANPTRTPSSTPTFHPTMLPSANPSFKPTRTFSDDIMTDDDILKTDLTTEPTYPPTTASPITTEGSYHHPLRDLAKYWYVLLVVLLVVYCLGRWSNRKGCGGNKEDEPPAPVQNKTKKTKSLKAKKANQKRDEEQGSVAMNTTVGSDASAVDVERGDREFVDISLDD